MVWAVAYLYPLLTAASIYSSWLVAWMCLGRVPRPLLDDPKFIGGVMDIAYLLSMLAFYSAPVLTPLCFASSFFCPLGRIRNRVARSIVLALAYLAMLAGVILLLRLDPGRVVEWWID